PRLRRTRSYRNSACTTHPRALRAPCRATWRATRAAWLGSSGSEYVRADVETAQAEDLVGGLSARRSDAVEAARQPLLDAGGLDRIGRCRKLLRQQSQLLRTEAVALPFERAQLRRLERHFLARWLAH